MKSLSLALSAVTTLAAAALVAAAPALAMPSSNTVGTAPPQRGSVSAERPDHDICAPVSHERGHEPVQVRYIDVMC
jgi:hypothetical protein